MREEKDERSVAFENGVPAHIMAVDGTRRRACSIRDISETGATVEGSVEGLALKEFFLLLSSTGLAYRRCELRRLNGDQMVINFLKQTKRRKSTTAAAEVDGKASRIVGSKDILQDAIAGK